MTVYKGKVDWDYFTQLGVPLQKIIGFRLIHPNAKPTVTYVVPESGYQLTVEADSYSLLEEESSDRKTLKVELSVSFIISK